jgi:hypothetical protein
MISRSSPFLCCVVHRVRPGDDSDEEMADLHDTGIDIRQGGELPTGTQGTEGQAHTLPFGSEQGEAPLADDLAPATLTSSLALKKPSSPGAHPSTDEVVLKAGTTPLASAASQGEIASSAAQPIAVAAALPHAGGSPVAVAAMPAETATATVEAAVSVPASAVNEPTASNGNIP